MPVDGVESRAKACALLRVDHRNESYPPLEVSAEVRVGLAILLNCAVTGAIGQDCLEAVELVAFRVGVRIDRQSGQVLTLAAAHDAGFVMIDLESFLKSHCRDVKREATRTPSKIRIAGEGKVVRVARISDPDAFCQRGKAAIESIGA